MKQAIGVDIGGTKVAVAAISSTGVLSQKVIGASQTETAEQMYDSVTEVIDLFLTQTQTTMDDYLGIGLGIPGKVNRQTGVAVFQNNLPWTNFPIVSRLTETYGKRQIMIDNDVYQATFAEWRASQLDIEAVFVYYTISTGIACAMMKGDSFIRGSGFAGEVGLAQVIDLRTEQKVERLELVASGPAVTQAGQTSYGEAQLTTAELFARYHRGEETAVTLINQMIESLTHSVYSIICLVDPAAIVFGGSLSLYQPFLIDAIKKRLEAYVIPAQVTAINRLSVSQLENNGGIIGAGLRLFSKE